MRATVDNAAQAPADQVEADAAWVRLRHPAALAWIDRTLRLEADVELCRAECRERIARAALLDVPPIVERSPAAESVMLRLSGELRLATARADVAERRLQAAGGSTLQWAWVAGVAGLAVGAAGGAFGVHCLK